MTPIAEPEGKGQGAMEKTKGTDMDIKAMVDRLEELVLRAERFGDRFSKQTEALTSCEQGMARLKKELTLEVEELRAQRHAIEHDLMKNIEKAVQKTIKSVLPEQMPGLVAGFVSKAESASQAMMNKAEKLGGRIDQTVQKASETIEIQHRCVTWMSYSIMAGIFGVSLLTACGIYYFFPTYSHIHYEMSDEMARSYFLGESVKRMYGSLTQKQKEQLHEEFGKVSRSAARK